MERGGTPASVVVLRSRRLTRRLDVLMGMMGALLAFEVARANVPDSWLGTWPWKVEMLGISTTAAIGTAVLIARIALAHHAGTDLPVLRAVSDRRDHSEAGLAGDAQGFWYVCLSNAGTSVAVVKSITWRMRSSVEGADMLTYTSIEQLREVLTNFGFTDQGTYSLSNYSPGTALAAGEDRLYFESGVTPLSALAAFEVTVEFESLLGDRLSRTVPLLPSAGARRTA